MTKANRGAAATPLPIVVLISGAGSNLQAIIDAIAHDDLPVEISAVISDRPEAQGLTRARQAQIPTLVVDRHDYSDRASFDKALQHGIDSYRPGLVVLAGFMRILGPEFVNHYLGRLINIHPSLLPAFQGLNTHKRALQQGTQEHGASVHFVTAELDGGPVVLQAKVAILPDDDATTLAWRVLQQEHRIYPQAIRWFAQGRLQLKDHKAYLDGIPLPMNPLDAEVAIYA